jgi:hypothetical protein
LTRDKRVIPTGLSLVIAGLDPAIHLNKRFYED